jgi:hypothetical protein
MLSTPAPLTSGLSRVGEKSVKTGIAAPLRLISTTLAQGLSPMLDGDVLHPFCQQSVAWDDLWLEQDHGSDLRVFVNGLRDKLENDADVQAVSEVGNFIMLLKRNTRAFQHKVDWKNPSSRVRTVIDWEGAAKSDPELLARLLQQSGWLHDK